MDQREAIRAITVPTLVVIGSYDIATPPALGEEIHVSIDGARARMLQAAHLSNIEQTEAFNAAVFGFLTGR
mgnify:CR=1 FL=1